MPLPFFLAIRTCTKFLFYILCLTHSLVQVLSGRNQLVNGISHRGKFLLILGHHISLIERRVMVQIKGMGHQVPLTLLNFLQRKLKQLAVIRLKFYHAFFCQNPVISFQKLPGSQSALGMALFWPGIGKIPLPHQKQGEALLHPCV